MALEGSFTFDSGHAEGTAYLKAGEPDAYSQVCIFKDEATRTADGPSQNRVVELNLTDEEKDAIKAIQYAALKRGDYSEWLDA